MSLLIGFLSLLLKQNFIGPGRCSLWMKNRPLIPSGYSKEIEFRPTYIYIVNRKVDCRWVKSTSSNTSPRKEEGKSPYRFEKSVDPIYDHTSLKIIFIWFSASWSPNEFFLEFLHQVLSRGPHSSPLAVDVHWHCSEQTGQLNAANSYKDPLGPVGLEPTVDEERKYQAMEDI